MRDRFWEIVVTAAVGSYFIVGLVFVLFVSSAFSWTKNWLPNDKPRDANQRRLRAGSAWTQVFVRHPILFVLQVALWPLYLAWYLNYRDAKDETEQQDGSNAR
ncbi:MAG TPA: hypothetical protein VM940_08930 [Chthoniobacterales bacterium]|nr:hypothetical protein [Chthoniobacterales bacterium]